VAVVTAKTAGPRSGMPPSSVEAESDMSRSELEETWTRHSSEGEEGEVEVELEIWVGRLKAGAVATLTSVPCLQRDSIVRVPGSQELVMIFA
jgi:hypothetical protein